MKVQTGRRSRAEREDGPRPRARQWWVAGVVGLVIAVSGVAASRLGDADIGILSAGLLGAGLVAGLVATLWRREVSALAADLGAARGHGRRPRNVVASTPPDATADDHAGGAPLRRAELAVPIDYGSDRQRAEAILLDTARRHTAKVLAAAHAVRDARGGRASAVVGTTLQPVVYYRLTERHLEMTLSFVATECDPGACVETLFRDVVAALRAAGIELPGARFGATNSRCPPVRLVRPPTGACDGAPRRLRWRRPPRGRR